MPEISVIIPTYNRGGLACEAVESVLTQTFRDFEIIMVDDGSTDNTAELIARYGRRVRYVHQDQCGRSAARNRGIMLAEGRYCAFLDSDDTWFPDKLERQIAELKSNPKLGLLHGPVEVVDGEGRRMGDVTDEFRAGLARQQARGETYEELLLHHTMYTSAAVMPRSVFDAVGLFDPALDPREDLDLYLRIALRYQVGSLSGSPVCRYRTRRDELIAPPDLSHVYIKVHRKHLEILRANQLISADRGRRAFRNLYVALARDYHAGKNDAAARSYLTKALKTDPSGALAEPAVIQLAVRVLAPPFLLNRFRRMRAGRRRIRKDGPEKGPAMLTYPGKQDHPEAAFRPGAKEMHCPVCSAECGCTEIERWDPYTLRRCPECDVVFADPMDSAGSDFYEDPGGHGYTCLDEIYGDRKVVRRGWESLSQNGRLLLKRKPAPGGRLLDIGCGEGVFLHYAKRHYRVMGIDVDRDAVNTARQMYGVDQVYPISLKQFSRTFGDNRFDVITMFDVLEHLDDPSGHLGIVSELLTADGVLVISVPNRERKSFAADMHAIADYPPNHMTRWNAAALKALVTRLGFEVLTLYSRRSDFYGLYESGDILRYRFKAVVIPLIRLMQRKRRLRLEDGSDRVFYEDSSASRAFKIALRSVSSLLWFPLWLPFRISGQASYGLWLVARRKAKTE